MRTFNKVNVSRIVGLFTLVLSSLWIASCSSVTVESYSGNFPKLIVDEFFDGDLSAHGVVKNRSGKVIRYFTADLKADWKEGIGTLDESFVFDDGERQKRIWTLTPNQGKGYTATAGDVVGSGDLMTSGNALFMKYVLQVPYNGDLINVNVDDRMYLVEDNVLLNESILTKFGFHVGSVTLVILKSP